MTKRRHVQELDLGAEQQMVLELVRRMIQRALTASRESCGR